MLFVLRVTFAAPNVMEPLLLPRPYTCNAAVNCHGENLIYAASKLALVHKLKTISFKKFKIVPVKQFEELEQTLLH